MILPVSLRLPHLAILGATAALIAVPVSAKGNVEPIEAIQEQTAQPADPVEPAPLAIVEADRFATFTPGTDPIRHTIDYEIWDFALENMVVSMGPSIRKSLGKPYALTGTRRTYGPDSRYRLEGSMVMFTFLDKDVIDSFTEYRRDLEATADLLDIQSILRNEQLAYWFNLHNVAMMEQIAKNWPMRQPRRFEIDGVPLDDAKFITVEGVKLSLRDIREKIVFQHWKDPKVIYGFWRGEIGGPTLQREAFTGGNVSSLLDNAAMEFINSLRGTQKRGRSLDVSELYAETAPFFFPDFENDVRAHIGQYAGDEVQRIMAKAKQTTPRIHEYDIADLSGGMREPKHLNVVDLLSGVPYRFRVPPLMSSLLRYRQRKLEWMKRYDIPTGTVTFSDIILPGDPPNKGEVE